MPPFTEAGGSGSERTLEPARAKLLYPGATPALPISAGIPLRKVTRVPCWEGSEGFALLQAGRGWHLNPPHPVFCRSSLSPCTAISLEGRAARGNELGLRRVDEGGARSRWCQETGVQPGSPPAPRFRPVLPVPHTFVARLPHEGASGRPAVSLHLLHAATRPGRHDQELRVGRRLGPAAPRMLGGR